VSSYSATGPYLELEQEIIMARGSKLSSLHGIVTGTVRTHGGEAVGQIGQPNSSAYLSHPSPKPKTKKVSGKVSKKKKGK